MGRAGDSQKDCTGTSNRGWMLCIFTAMVLLSIRFSCFTNDAMKHPRQFSPGGIEWKQVADQLKKELVTAENREHLLRQEVKFQQSAIAGLEEAVALVEATLSDSHAIEQFRVAHKKVADKALLVSLVAPGRNATVPPPRNASAGLADDTLDRRASQSPGAAAHLSSLATQMEQLQLQAKQQAIRLKRLEDQTQGMVAPSVLRFALRSLQHRDPAKKMFLFTHHKTGTVLCSRLALHMQTIIPGLTTQMAWDMYGDNREVDYVCPEAQVVVYGAMDLALLEAIQTHCPDDWRAVHFIRDPFEITLSAYLYHLRTDGDSIPGTGQAELQGKSLVDGLKQEANADKLHIFPGMLAIHTAAKSDSNRFLEVRFEDVKTDFDAMTEQVFRWLLGHSHPKIREIVVSASSEDTERWDAEARSWGHLADRREKKKARDALKKLLPDMKQLQSFRRLMGYIDPEVA